MNGRLNLLGKLTFFYHKWQKTCRKVLGLVFGVVPEHQDKGVEGAIFMAPRKRWYRRNTPTLLPRAENELDGRLQSLINPQDYGAGW